jgi:hypothetical protein
MIHVVKHLNTTHHGRFHHYRGQIILVEPKYKTSNEYYCATLFY